MDASAVLAALATNDVGLLLDELPWDEREIVNMPDGRGPATVGRVGLYAIIWSEVTGLGVHAHEDEAEAIACQAWKVDMLRQMVADETFVRMADEVQRDLDSLDDPYVGRHIRPDDTPRYI